MNSAQTDPAVSYLTFLSTASDERLAKVAARRAFVEMKVCFMAAAEQVPGAPGPRLRRRARAAMELPELWRLREPLFTHLPAHDPQSAACREALQYHLDSAFPASGPGLPPA